MLKKFTITKKLTLLVTLVVVVTTAVLSYSVNNEYDKILTQQELKNMGEEISEEIARIQSTLERTKEDLLFLSETPPIQGIIRASRNNGIDDSDGSSESLWKKRLKSIFISFLKSKQHFSNIQYIDINNKGKEFVIIGETKGDDINEKNINAALRPYFKKNANLKNNTVYLTNVEYSRVDGKATKSYLTEMHAISPIFSNESNIFGVVVLTLDMDYIFSRFLSSVDKNQKDRFKYIVNNNGNYLSAHEGQNRLKLAGSSNAFLEYDEWAVFYKDSNKESLLSTIIENNKKFALYAKKMFFDEIDKNGFMVFSQKIL